MYFKSLDLYGFKSFAGKTKVDFEPGITAIVGPNGCGKSNIVDSLKWVLGEQSAKDLRGSNMEDVIFNGTDTRDPVGFAEVSLTLSNETKFLPIEYDEVVVTRRLFRSGESEYLLNKNQVRLKDIIELFMGTGVGTSAYSVIEQGKIDMIISSKPEDRRYIFEEASGIIKYKSKKREAARKLEYTENNLLRVNDIIEEVKRQIGSIERQARKAERYKEEFERLKALDTKVAFLEFKRLNEDKGSSTNDEADLKRMEAALFDEVSRFGAKLQELRARQAEIDTKLSEVQFNEMNLNSTIEKSNHKIGLNEERDKELELLKQALLNEQTSTQKAILELQEKIAVLNNEVGGISGNRVQKENILHQKEGRFKKLEEDIKHNEQVIRDGKLKIVDVLSLHSKTRNDLAKISSDLSNFQARERRLRLEQEEVKKELTGINEQFSQVSDEVSGLETKIDETMKHKEALETELGRKDNQIAEITKKIEDLKSRQLSLDSRLALLKDMVERYEGFESGSKAILLERQDNKLNIPGVYGAIAELINVKKGYETAVEASLGGLLQCIVVENKNAAIELMRYLKDRSLGKATIASLDSLGAAGPDDEGSAAQEGILGRLRDFVEAEERFKGLISVLFHNVYLVKDVAALLDVNTGFNRDVKFVTPSGEILERGFLTGGTTENDSATGILNRKLQIKEIEEELIGIKQEAANLGSLKESLTREANGLLDTIDSQAETLRQNELVLANKRSQKENIEASLKKVTDESSLLTLELDEVTEEIDLLRTRQTFLESESRRLDEENNSVQTVITSSQVFMDAALKEKEGLLVEVTRIRTELAAVSEQEKGFLANLKLQEEFLNSQTSLLNEKQKTFDDSNIRQAELKNDISLLQIAVKEAQAQKEKISLEFQDVKNKKRELEMLVSESEGEFRGKEKALNESKDKLHHLQMKLQEDSFKLETLKTRVSQSYKIELEQLTTEVEEDFDLEAVNNEILELRQKIEKMGPVNLVAIEEHQELRERFDFLTKQKDDLINAKESLLEAIRKINKTTRELFMDTFQKVRVEFKEYFRYLFGGGQAELVLMDEQDVLECGIEILARPPGKKLQSISLLSGGEKALTAISLLFSIFKVKPSPFCILDEVDAPLDESNIGRFTKLLSDFTKTSQFIIITHNKKTISMADVMYGITMEQSGVSKVVSVKFAKEAHKASPVLVNQTK
jgi:chromosome segregation protein